MTSPASVRRLVLLAMLASSGMAIAAGDPERGRELAVACAACHGLDGNSPSPAFPILAGQHEAYLVQSIRAYQSGERRDAVMGGAVRTMSAQDIDDLAAWYAGQSGLGGAALAAPESVPDAPMNLVRSSPGSVQRPRGEAEAAGCPTGGGSADRDGDGLADAHDAAPADPAEFARDADGDGWLEICSLAQLQAIQTLRPPPGGDADAALAARLARRYELARHIDASGVEDFLPVGNCGPENNCMLSGDRYGFTGSFDGNDRLIRGLAIERAGTGGVGLFGVLAKSGVVRGVVLLDASVRGLHGVGALVGANFGLVTDSFVTGRVTGSNAAGVMVGGNAGTVENSHARGSVRGEAAVGGLVGDMRGMIRRSSADSRVEGTNGVGGLVGLNTYGRVIDSSSRGRVSGTKNVGGLVGVNTDALVANSYSAASVAGSATNAGGLVGFNSLSTIRNCYAAGEVAGNDAVGGLVGTNNGQIVHCYASGPVRGRHAVGGLVGEVAGGSIVASYWDQKATGRRFGVGSDDSSANTAKNDNNRRDRGETNTLSAFARTAAELGAMAGDSGWLPGDGTLAEPLLYYCDVNLDERIDDEERSVDNLVWNFPGGDAPPELRCARDNSDAAGPGT